MKDGTKLHDSCKKNSINSHLVFFNFVKNVRKKMLAENKN
jgi:hypothetical protein